MPYSVPTTGDATEAGKSMAIQGGALGVGESLGRSILGPGIGTAVGGLAVASMNDGQDRKTQATIVGERAVSELMGGADSGGASGSTGGRGKM